MVSIRRTDLCAFEPGNQALHIFDVAMVSIRRTDLCAFELRRSVAGIRSEAVFQSVERICVPSNAVASEVVIQPDNVSIRRTDLCAFELQALGIVGLERDRVSIRRTDLCAFEQLHEREAALAHA